jgi:uncharacterized protein DUF5348
MGRLIIFQQDGILELDGFPLQIGDRVEILLLGSWVAGTIAHDEQGWYVVTREWLGIRLQTGVIACLLSLSSVIQPQTGPLPAMLGNASPWFGRRPTTRLLDGEFAGSRTKMVMLRKCSLLAAPDATLERQPLQWLGIVVRD